MSEMSDHDREIVAHYAAKDAAVEIERQEHLAAGKPIDSFVPKTLID